MLHDSGRRDARTELLDRGGCTRSGQVPIRSIKVVAGWRFIEAIRKLAEDSLLTHVDVLIRMVQKGAKDLQRGDVY